MKLQTTGTTALYLTSFAYISVRISKWFGYCYSSVGDSTIFEVYCDFSSVYNNVYVLCRMVHFYLNLVLHPLFDTVNSIFPGAVCNSCSVTAIESHGGSELRLQARVWGLDKANSCHKQEMVGCIIV